MMDTKDRIQIIDAIKGLAIISVILLHILPGIVLNYTYSSFHIGQAVPIFLFISFYLSFKGIKDRGDSLLNYFNKRRIGRLLTGSLSILYSSNMSNDYNIAAK